MNMHDQMKSIYGNYKKNVRLNGELKTVVLNDVIKSLLSIYIIVMLVLEIGILYSHLLYLSRNTVLFNTLKTEKLKCSRQQC